MVPPVFTAIFFELFWLDLFAIGSFIPPTPSFPLLILLALAPSFGWSNPEHLAVPLALCLPLAYVPSYVEMRLRNRQIRGYTLLMEQSRLPEPLGNIPGRLIARSLTLYIIIAAGLFIVGYSFFWGLFDLLAISLESIADLLQMGWAPLLAVGTIGGVSALRIPRAYTVFAVASATAFAISLFFFVP